MKMLPFEAQLISFVLEESIAQLQVLGEVLRFSEKAENEALLRSELGKGSMFLKPKDGASVRLSTKFQKDRNFLASVFSTMLKEVSEKGTLNSLKETLEKEKKNKKEHEAALQKAENKCQKVKVLQNEIQQIKKMGEMELNDLEERIFHLKNQLQEAKARTEMEIRYTKNKVANDIIQAKKQCKEHEENLRKKVEKLRDQIDYETRAHAEMDNFLANYLSELQQKTEYWTQKYDTDVYDKDNEIAILKSQRATNKQRIAEQARLYQVYQDVIEDDYKQKKIEFERQQEEERNEKAAIKIQAWWRGTMVRRGIGPYSKRKKAGKKGLKKGSKKGGKKKKK
ncbi:IQ domain-containing protein G-like [Limulus polyphemus]|uniref:Dynein regulatory complex protein 9 n=1 Tax=Limulus polyphemus TaxID=6850 RepID=A0ABM1T0M4_LIMPO|nr:IQ domain-containing protein G-like [Limulus polyphemus]